MSILLDEKTSVIVQGITGKIARVQTKWMLDYGTAVVGGVTPGKGGGTVEGLPVFDSVEEAVKETGATASVFSLGAAGTVGSFATAMVSPVFMASVNLLDRLPSLMISVRISAACE